MQFGIIQFGKIQFEEYSLEKKLAWDDNESLVQDNDVFGQRVTESVLVYSFPVMPWSVKINFKVK